MANQPTVKTITEFMLPIALSFVAGALGIGFNAGEIKASVTNIEKLVNVRLEAMDKKLDMQSQHLKELIEISRSKR